VKVNLTWPGGKKLEIFNPSSSIYPKKSENNKMDVDANSWTDVVETPQNIERPDWRQNLAF
jgi:hypothetical protein